MLQAQSPILSIMYYCIECLFCDFYIPAVDYYYLDVKEGCVVHEVESVAFLWRLLGLPSPKLQNVCKLFLVQFGIREDCDVNETLVCINQEVS